MPIEYAKILQAMIYALYNLMEGSQFALVKIT